MSSENIQATTVVSGSALVVGASRGLGLALTRQLLDSRPEHPVMATHRPGRCSDRLKELQREHRQTLILQELDFTCPDSLRTLTGRLGELPPLALAIHAAGMLHDGSIQPEKALEHCRPDHLARLFEVNSIGPLMVARAVMPAIEKDQAFTFAALSAMVGSIGDNRRGGWYAYRASKAALNQFMRTLAVECRRRWPGSAIVAIHPGTTDTELSQPFQRNISPEKLYQPATSAQRILSVLSNLGAEQSGRFYNWDGSQIPW